MASACRFALDYGSAILHAAYCQFFHKSLSIVHLNYILNLLYNFFPCQPAPWATVGSVATLNRCLLNSEVMYWKEAGPSQLPWQALQSPSYRILLKHHRDKLRSFQCVWLSATGYTLYHLIWRLSLKPSLNTSNSPGWDRTWHVCPHSCYY